MFDHFRPGTAGVVAGADVVEESDIATVRSFAVLLNVVARDHVSFTVGDLDGHHDLGGDAVELLQSPS